MAKKKAGAEGPKVIDIQERRKPSKKDKAVKVEKPVVEESK